MRTRIVLAALLGVTLLSGGALAVDNPADQDPFVGFISPVSNPTNFEDPRSLTEVRPIFIYHQIPDTFPVGNIPALGLGNVGGGDAYVVAAQIRLAITDRFSFIATKDGYTWVNLKNQTLRGLVAANNHGNSHGWANLAFGFKGTIWQMADDDNKAMVSGGLRYEAASGSRAVWQGYGKGLLNPFLSALWGTDRLHLMAYTGPRLALSGAQSSFYDLSVHADYRFENFFPLVEVNWIHCLTGGNGDIPLSSVVDGEGFDFFNFGATQAGGTGVATMALGARWRVTDHKELFRPIEIADRVGVIDVGTAFEFPLTSQKWLTDWRITTDLIFRIAPGALVF